MDIFSYEFGALIAVFIFSIDLLDDIHHFLLFEKTNYKEIDRTYSYWSRSYVEQAVDPQYHWFVKLLGFACLIGFRLSLCIFSWIYVAFSVAGALINFREYLLTPNSVKEARWRLRRVRLSKEDVIETVLKANGTYSKKNLNMMRSHFGVKEESA